MGRGKMVTIASCALAKGYASTVVYAARARIVEGVKYASTVVNAVSARNVEGHQYAITVVDAISARIVEGHQYANTIVYAVSARNAKGVKNEANGTFGLAQHAVALPYFPTDNSGCSQRAFGRFFCFFFPAKRWMNALRGLIELSMVCDRNT